MHSSRRHRGGSGTSRPSSGSSKLTEYAGGVRRFADFLDHLRLPWAVLAGRLKALTAQPA